MRAQVCLCIQGVCVHLCACLFVCVRACVCTQERLVSLVAALKSPAVRIGVHAERNYYKGRAWKASRRH